MHADAGYEPVRLRPQSLRHAVQHQQQQQAVVAEQPARLQSHTQRFTAANPRPDSLLVKHSLQVRAERTRIGAHIPHRQHNFRVEFPCSNRGTVVVAPQKKSGWISCLAACTALRQSSRQPPAAPQAPRQHLHSSMHADTDNSSSSVASLPSRPVLLLCKSGPAHSLSAAPQQQQHLQSTRREESAHM